MFPLEIEHFVPFYRICANMRRFCLVMCLGTNEFAQKKNFSFSRVSSSPMNRMQFNTYLRTLF